VTILLLTTSRCRRESIALGSFSCGQKEALFPERGADAVGFALDLLADLGLPVGIGGELGMAGRQFVKMFEGGCAAALAEAPADELAPGGANGRRESDFERDKFAIQFGARGEDGARVGIRVGGEHTGIGAGGAQSAIGPEECRSFPIADC